MNKIPIGRFLAGMLLSLTILLPAASWSETFTPPASYDVFVPVTAYSNLTAAIAAKEHVYIPPGRYTLANPIVINRDRPLYLHGGDRMETWLTANDPSQPLFIVKACALLNIAGMELFGPGGATPAIRFDNAEPVQFEALDAFFRGRGLQIEGPGSFRSQGVFFEGTTDINASIILDHPEADLLVMAGNMANYPQNHTLPLDQIFHVWQKRGRFRIYGTGVQCARGTADFRIDSGSVLGPHVLCNVRSEGNNAYRQGEIVSGFLYVSPSEEHVDVVVMNSSGSWPQPHGSARFVDYNAAGTLWLLGNHSGFAVRRMVTGNAPNATVVAFGNRIYDDLDPLPVTGARKIFAGNMYFYYESSGDAAAGRFNAPLDRLVHPDAKLSDYEDIPAVPQVPLPMPLTRPKANSPLPGMVSVKDPAYSAVGDGTHDDTAALQAAFDAARMVFLPAGTYRTTSPIGYVHSSLGGVNRSAGGWIAGAGSDKTRIVRDPAPDGKCLVFETEGMAYATIQGITFQTAAWSAENDVAEANTALENKDGFGHATQENMFHDCRFIGGKYALAMGLRTGTMCSENLMANCEFADAKYGLGVGSFNALANIVYRGTFRNNENTTGHSESNAGGTWSLIHCNVTGTRAMDAGLRESGHGVWYFHDVKSDSLQFFMRWQATGAFFPILLDQCELAPRAEPTRDMFHYLTAGGPIFLHSQMTRGKVGLVSPFTSSYAFKLHSDVAEWDGPPDTDGMAMKVNRSQEEKQDD